MIHLADGEHVVAAYCMDDKHYAMTNHGNLWSCWEKGRGSDTKWRPV